MIVGDSLVGRGSLGQSSSQYGKTAGESPAASSDSSLPLKTAQARLIGGRRQLRHSELCG